ncbi:PREDICTED: glycine-rich cell wall structural protein-like [Polistes dominula]|uniref:Glycine-rich cell wall structural protein-like n=1 Tax=Polistes dominula TaxID=743375 RepID=A0ABM1JG88_POLDO|nr:PREDICTED: glycine-rich cell wall structural protein-like [Polistes dominula]
MAAKFLHNARVTTIDGYDLKGSTGARSRFYTRRYINSDEEKHEYTRRSELSKMKALFVSQVIILVVCTTFATGAPSSRERREIYSGYGHGYHGGYPGHGVALAGPLLGHTSVAGPHVGASVLSGPSIGPAKLSGSASGPVHVSGAVAGPAVVTASVAGPAYVEGYNGPYDGGYYSSPSLGGYASPGYIGYAGYAGPAGHGGYGGYAGAAGHAGHGVILAGPASHGAVVSGPHSGGSSVAGPHAGSVIIAGPSGKITAHGAGYGSVHAGLHNHGHW